MSYKKGFRQYKNMGLETSKEMDAIFKEAEEDMNEYGTPLMDKKTIALCDKIEAELHEEYFGDEELKE